MISGNHEPSFIFVHINKCGGSSIHRALRHVDAERTGHRTFKNILYTSKIDNPEDFFKFSFIRNPWSKMVSFYNYHDKRRGWDFCGWPWDKNNPPEFNDFIKLIYEESFPWRAVWQHDRFKSSHKQTIPLRVSNSYDWLVDKSGKFSMDFVGRVENMSEDYMFVCKKLGLPQTRPPHINKSSREKPKHYAEYYDDEARELVAFNFSKDIEHFGYTFETP